MGVGGGSTFMCQKNKTYSNNQNNVLPGIKSVYSFESSFM